eukprot:NODE_1058_length_2395_cov_0.515679.p2 type:complete len:253 gc:universal NODE_1058_length_2395_cov_0.515679:2180-1422(-)
MASNESDVLMRKYVRHALFEESKIIISKQQISNYQKSKQFIKFVDYIEKLSFNLDPLLLNTLYHVYERFGILDRYSRVINLLVDRNKVGEMVKKSVTNWTWEDINYLETYKVHAFDGLNEFFKSYFTAMIQLAYESPAKRQLAPTLKQFSCKEWATVEVKSLFKIYRQFDLRIRAVKGISIDTITLGLENKLNFILNNFLYGQIEIHRIFEQCFLEHRLHSIPLILDCYHNRDLEFLQLQAYPTEARAEILK